MRRLLIAVTVTLLLSQGLPASAQDPSIGATVQCSEPGRAEITNRTNAAITVTSVGSLFEPGAEEPYRRNDQVQPGESRTYGFGPDAPGIRLSGQTIFAPDEPREGVRFETSVGTFDVLCSERDRTFPIGAATATGTPTATATQTLTQTPTQTPAVSPSPFSPAAPPQTPTGIATGIPIQTATRMPTSTATQLPTQPATQTVIFRVQTPPATPTGTPAPVFVQAETPTPAVAAAPRPARAGPRSRRTSSF